MSRRPPPRPNPLDDLAVDSPNDRPCHVSGMATSCGLPPSLPLEVRLQLGMTGWTFEPRYGRRGQLWRLAIREPCPACRQLRDELYGRWAYMIGYWTSFLDLDDFHLHCDNKRLQVACAACVSGGMPPHRWIAEFLPGMDPHALDGIVGER